MFCTATRSPRKSRGATESRPKRPPASSFNRRNWRSQPTAAGFSRKPRKDSRLGRIGAVWCRTGSFAAIAMRVMEELERVRRSGRGESCDRRRSTEPLLSREELLSLVFFWFLSFWSDCAGLGVSCAHVSKYRSQAPSRVVKGGEYNEKCRWKCDGMLLTDRGRAKVR